MINNNNNMLKYLKDSRALKPQGDFKKDLAQEPSHSSALCDARKFVLLHFSSQGGQKGICGLPRHLVSQQSCEAVQKIVTTSRIPRGHDGRILTRFLSGQVLIAYQGLGSMFLFLVLRGKFQFGKHLVGWGGEHTLAMGGWPRLIMMLYYSKIAHGKSWQLK